MTPWLTVVGIGDDGLDGLGAATRSLIDNAEVLVGGDRHLTMLAGHPAEHLGWQFPLDPLIEELKARRGKRVVVLATGDPMSFGIGTTLCRHLDIAEMRLIPAPSAFALACSRLGWPRHTVEALTLHGRPLEILNGWLQPGQRLLLLSHDGTTPSKVARLLTDKGFGGSRVTVLEHMGGPAEARHDALARDWPHDGTADLNTIAVELGADADAIVHPRVPGLPDAAFVNDGQLTKREVRAATLAALMPISGQFLWDVGAGCGSIAIEWLRAAANTRAIAIEHKPDRLALIAENAVALGVPQLSVIEGTAPDALVGLDVPDAIFVGGGLTADGLFDRCWSALRPGGRMVANAVTVEGERMLLGWRDAVGGDLTRIAVSRAEPVGLFTGWRPLMPVTQWAAVKS